MLDKWTCLRFVSTVNDWHLKDSASCAVDGGGPEIESPSTLAGMWLPGKALESVEYAVLRLEKSR